MFIFLIYLCLIILILFFLYYPFVYSTENSHQAFFHDTDKNDDLAIDRQDKILSIQNSLKDLHLENQIGKLSDQDFNALKAELLKEWSKIS